MKLAIFGLTLSSSWGNGHATLWRGLCRALARLGHRVVFFERDVPYYAAQRDLPQPPWGETHLYGSLDELEQRFCPTLESADLVIVGSYVPDGVAVIDLVLAKVGA